MATSATPAIVPTSSTDALTPAESERIGTYIDASLSPATRRAYGSALRCFHAWCDATGRTGCPTSAEAVAAYLVACADAGKSISALSQRLAAIKWEHQRRGHTSPTSSPGVADTMAGIRRTKGVAPKRKTAATVERLAAMLAHVDRDTTKGKRDAALLLLGFATACRRSELVALELADVELVEKGLLVTVRRGKTDQEGKGHQRAILYGKREELCPVLAFLDWFKLLDDAGAFDESDRVFRSVTRHGQIGESLRPAAVATLVQGYAELAGLDPAEFGGHSLRSGFVTSAAERGATSERIMDHTGHQSVGMIRVYTRRSDAFADHAGAGLL